MGNVFFLIRISCNCCSGCVNKLVIILCIYIYFLMIDKYLMGIYLMRLDMNFIFSVN